MQPNEAKRIACPTTPERPEASWLTFYPCLTGDHANHDYRALRFATMKEALLSLANEGA